jgi:hypothetical protein
LEDRVLLSGTPNGDYLPPGHHLTSYGDFLTGPSSSDPLEIALDFATERAADLELSPNDFADHVVTDQYVSSHTGMTHIYLGQTYNGLEVANTSMNFNVMADGRVLSVGSSFVSGLGDAGPPSDLQVDVEADAALAAFASSLGLSVTPSVVTPPHGREQSTVLDDSGVFREDVSAQLHYVPTPGGDVELAWSMSVQPMEGVHLYDASVSAVDGEVLFASDRVLNAQYRVVEFPNESPDENGRSIVVDPDDPIASPFGWHNISGGPSDDFNDTRGNNVFAQADRDGLNPMPVWGLGTRPRGGPNLNFDYPMSLIQSPVYYEDAAVTNLFYVTNTLHDIHYQYGFDEEAGNFQFNNFGKGGVDKDQLYAYAQVGGEQTANNAFFIPTLDGTPPAIAMFEFNMDFSDGAPMAISRDGDLDNGIVIHEYGHGVSNRLAGGPSTFALNRIESGSMGEGWSDWWALMLTQKPGDAANDLRYMGTHVQKQQRDTGPGFRNWPYTFDMTANPLTYARFNLANGWPDASNPGPFKLNPGFEVHNAGEIWAATLWDLNWLLINGDGDRIPAKGFDDDFYDGTGGNNLAFQLVMDGLKIQPSNPTFLDGRDAILAADEALTGGENQLAIWTAFARRGMGFSADDDAFQVIPDVLSFVTEAFDLPPELVPSPGIILVQGTVFDDTDGNGIQEGAERGVPGWTVFLDANDNGTPDATERSTVTGQAGSYTFRNVDPGMTVALVVASDFFQTFPANNATQSAAGVEGDYITGLDFGIAKFVGGSISGLKWRDIDIDGNTLGVRDPGEPGLSNVFIYTDLNNDHVPGVDEPGVITAGDGTYTLGGLAPGSYTIREQVPANMLQTFPDPHTFDQHPTELGAWFVNLNLGEHVTGIDFGNVAQIAIDDTFAVDEGSVDNVLDVLANDNDAGNGTLVITALSDPSEGGAARIAPDGKAVIYTPLNDFFGIETFVYRVNDGLGNIDEAQVTVEVVDVNDKPIAVDDMFTVKEDSADNVLDVLANDYDPDGDSLLITDVGATSGAGDVTIASDGKSLIYTPAPGFIGEEVISYYEITDGRGEADRAKVTIDVQPSIDLVEFHLQTTNLAGIPISSVTEGEDFLLKGFVEDVQMDPEGVFAAYLDVLYETALVSVTGAIGPGSDPIYVNARSGSTTTPGLIDEVGGTDGEGLPAGTEGDLHILFSVQLTADAIGAVTFAGEPADVLPRHYVLLFGSDDPVPLENIIYGTTSIEVTGIEFTARDDFFEVLEDSVDNPLDVLANDSLGPGGGTLEITDVGSTSAGGTVVNVDGAMLIYTPVGDFFGIETFSYTITDGLGNFDQALVTVDVTPTHDPPIAVDDFYDVNADSIDNVLDVLANDLIDPGVGGTLVITAVGPTSAGGAVTITDDQLDLLYSPAVDFLGTETFTYTIDDGNGGSDSATVTVDVVSPGPLVDLSLIATDLAGNPISSVPLGATFMLDVYVQDLRPEPEGAFAAYLDVLYNEVLVSAGETIIPGPEYPNATSGSTSTPGLIDEAGGADGLGLPAGAEEVPLLLLSVPFSADALGEVTFTGDPADLSPAHDVLLFGRTSPVPTGRIAYGTTSITVTLLQFAAEDDDFEVFEDSVDNPLDVLRNDTLGPDGGTLEITEVGPTSDSGVVTIVDSQFLEYTPVGDFFGTETFTYTITDGLGNFDQALVTVDVSPLNDDPIAVDDFYNVDADTLLNELDVLENDLIDPDVGETLVITAVGPTSHSGVVEIRPDQLMLLYTPAVGFTGTETFTYTIGDGNGGSDSATVTVDVVGADPLVEFRLATTDLVGAPVSSVMVGQDFLLDVFVTDIRMDPVGVFAAYLDVLYDELLVSVSGNIVPGPVYPNSPSGSTATPGLIDEAGGTDGLNVPPGTEGDAHLLWSIQLTADAVGSLTFTGSRDDMTSPAHDVLIFGPDTPVPLSQILFVDTTLSIESLQFTNPANPLDVNDDGYVAPSDALAIINDLNRNGARSLLLPGSVAAQSIVPQPVELIRPTGYVDVNGDHSISPIDALLVINALNAAADQPQDALKAIALDVAPMTRSVAASVSQDNPATSVALDLLPVTTGAALADESPVSGTVVEPFEPSASEMFIPRVGRVTASYSARINRGLSAAQAPVSGRDGANATDELEYVLTEIAADVSVAWQDTNTKDDFPQS